MHSQIVLTNYPLSKGFRDRLGGQLGDHPRYVNVSDLRQRSLWGMISALLRMRADRALVAVDDESSRAILPVLKLLAALIRARRLCIVDANLQVVNFSRLSALWAAFGVVVESIKALSAVLMSAASVARLLRSPRVGCLVDRYERATYLNCNLYFGVKAGGSVGHISGVANALMDLGVDLTFVSVVGRLLVDDRAEFVPLAPPRTLAIPFEATHYRFDRRLDRQLRAISRASRPDFIYQRMSLGNFAGVRLSRALRVPLVIEYNGSEAWIAKNWGRALRFHRLAVGAEDVCLRHAHVVITVSAALGDELIARGVEASRILVYPNCIDPKVFDPSKFTASDCAQLRATLGLESDDLVATFVGTFGEWHGADVLAEAIRILVMEDREFLDNARLRFVLVGDGPKMAAVKSTLATCNSEAYVRITGLVAQREAPRYLAASDILLSPHVPNRDGSAFFGSPTKLFEYMAMGKVIVASDLDQIGQVLRPAIEMASDSQLTVPPRSDQRAILVTPGSARAIADGLKLACGNEVLRKSLGDNARAAALNEFTWVHHTRAILDRLAEIEPPRSTGG